MDVDTAAAAILIAHQRRDIGSCLCGWDKLGRLHAGHLVEKLREARLLIPASEHAPDEAERIVTELREAGRLR